MFKFLAQHDANTSAYVATNADRGRARYAGSDGGVQPDRIEVVGGLRVALFGATPTALREARARGDKVAILVGSHGRGGAMGQMFPLAQRVATEASVRGTVHVVVAVIDQRNHGSRAIDEKRNTTWKRGNQTHGLDMWSAQYGTARDFSYLVDVLPFFLDDGSSSAKLDVVHWGVFGRSMGGHSAFLAVANDPRFQSCCSIIGCPDYLSLMTHRAQRSNTPFPPESYASFNATLLDALQRHDPVNHVDAFVGRSVMYLSGGKDNLVPNSHAQHFWLELTQREPIHKFWIQEDEAGHDSTPAMENHAVKFFTDAIRRSVS